MTYVQAGTISLLGEKSKITPDILPKLKACYSINLKFYNWLTSLFIYIGMQPGFKISSLIFCTVELAVTQNWSWSSDAHSWNCSAAFKKWLEMLFVKVSEQKSLQYP